MSDVSRSVYQKLAEENKRLKVDIWQMVMRPVTGQTILLKAKWRGKFERDQELRQALHEYAVQYVKDNPDSVVAQMAKEFSTEK
jgi:hypothetical protein